MKSRKIIALLLLVTALLFTVSRLHLLEPAKKDSFNRHPSHLVYTRHAECRMDCRHISKEDIDEILHKGTINFNKTDLHDRPCPTYAVQGYTNGHESIRVIFAQCDSITKVVTCYNLHREFACDCPGDKHASLNLPSKNSNE